MCAQLVFCRRCRYVLLLNSNRFLIETQIQNNAKDDDGEMVWLTGNLTKLSNQIKLDQLYIK